jgi:hypothetical protein
MEPCVLISIVVSLIVAYVMYKKEMARRLAIVKALKLYQDSLDEYAISQEILHKIVALGYGRYHASLANKTGNVWMLDEMRISNDIMVRTK